MLQRFLLATALPAAPAHLLALLAALAPVAAPPPARAADPAGPESLTVEERAFRAILSKEALEEYTALPADPPGPRAEWRRRFWMRNDPDPTTMTNERRVEHERRLAKAREWFGDAGALAWDDRCAALVRFGEPLVRVRDPGEVRGRYGLDPPRERWLYDDLFLHMEDPDLDGTFEQGITPLVSNIGRLDNIGEEDEFFRNAPSPDPRPNRLIDFSEHPEVEEHFTDFSDAKLIKMLENGREAWQKEPSVVRSERTGREIPFYFGVSTFRGAEGTADLVVDYLIPAEALTRDERGAWVERRTVVLDADLHLAGSDIEAIEQPLSGGSARGKWLLNVATIQVPPGDYEVASRVMDLLSPEKPMGLIRTRARVPDYANGVLGMSDILFGSAVVADTAGAASREGVARRGWRIVPLAVRRFERPSAPHIYFEVYNLAADGGGRHRYSVEYSLSRREKKGFLAFLGGGAKGKLSPGVSAAFTRETRAPDDAQWITIDTRDLPPDTYFIETRVRDLVSGAETSRKESFVVAGEKTG